MQKKFFLQKNLRPAGKQSYIKFLLWAAVGLVILVILAPLISRPKGPKQLASQKPLTEKSGIVTREVPKSPSSIADNNSALDSLPGGLGRGSDQNPETFSDVRSLTDIGAKPSTAVAPQNSTSEAKTTGMPSDQQQKVPGTEPAALQNSPAGAGTTQTSSLNTLKETQPPLQKESTIVSKDKAPVAGNPHAPGSPSDPAKSQKQNQLSAAPTVSNKPGKPNAKLASLQSLKNKPDSIIESQKKQASSKDMFTVQVGSFRDKQNADEMKQNLQKRGYAVLVKSTSHPKLGQLYVVQLEPVSEARKASTLVAQIKNEAKVKPVILKVPATE